MAQDNLNANATQGIKFEKEKHLRFLQGCLRLLPATYASQDPNRLTLLYFIVSGLDLFDATHLLKDKQAVIDWVYSLQVLPDEKDPHLFSFNCGFRGSPFFGVPYDPSRIAGCAHEHDQAHIAMTYTALCILIMVGDDLARVNRAAIVSALRHLQQPDGSFASTAGKSENDMRFLYCACTISTILGDWSGVDRDRALDYVLRSRAYDFAFGQAPGQEGHGGSTYCAVAACALMGRLDALGFLEWEKQLAFDHIAAGHHGPAVNYDTNAIGLVETLIERQTTGFQGRLGKDPDACYSWWIGASLHALGHFDQLDRVQLSQFLLACQSPIGGFGKYPDTHPDVLHTYFSLCGLSFLQEPGLQKLHCCLGMTMKSAARIPAMKEPLRRFFLEDEV